MRYTRYFRYPQEGARQPTMRTPGGSSLASDVADLLSPASGSPPDLQKWRHRSVEVISNLIEQARRGCNRRTGGRDGSLCTCSTNSRSTL